MIPMLIIETTVNVGATVGRGLVRGLAYGAELSFASLRLFARDYLPGIARTFGRAAVNAPRFGFNAWGAFGNIGGAVGETIHSIASGELQHDLFRGPLDQMRDELSPGEIKPIDLEKLKAGLEQRLEDQREVIRIELQTAVINAARRIHAFGIGGFSDNFSSVRGVFDQELAAAGQRAQAILRQQRGMDDQLFGSILAAA